MPRRHSPFGLAMVIVLAGVGASGVLTGLTASQVDAWCDGFGAERQESWDLKEDGKVVNRGREFAISGTCNENNYYQGEYIDLRIDGRDVYMQAWVGKSKEKYKVNGSTKQRLGYKILDSDREAPIQICVTKPNRCDVWKKNRGF